MGSAEVRKIVFASLLLILSGIFIVYYHNAQISSSREDAVSFLRDEQRLEGVSVIRASLEAYLEKRGDLPITISKEEMDICRSDLKHVDCTGLADLSFLFEEFLAAIPVDPTYKGGNKTGFKIQKIDNTLIILAPLAEENLLKEEISLRH